MMTPREAEVATENWLKGPSVGCVHTRRAARTRFFAVDFFGSDVMGKTRDGETWYVQTTTSQQSGKVLERKKALEAIAWNPNEHVFVFEVEERQGIVNPREKEFFFRVHEYVHMPVGPRFWNIWLHPICITKEMRRTGRRKSQARGLADRQGSSPG